MTEQLAGRFKPTFIAAVPKIWDIIKKGAEDKAKGGSPVKVPRCSYFPKALRRTHLGSAIWPGDDVPRDGEDPNPVSEEGTCGCAAVLERACGGREQAMGGSFVYVKSRISQQSHQPAVVSASSCCMSEQAHQPTGE